MAITRSTIPSLLTEDQKRVFGESYEQYPKQYKDFFDIESSKSDVELYREVGGLGLHVKKPEGSNITLDSPNEGPQTIIDNVAYALGYRVTHETIADGKYQKALNNALDLGVSAGQTEETAIVNRLNTAFSTSTSDLLANGQAMCSTAQPLSGAGGTNQNRPTTGASLSEASLIVDMNNIASFKDPSGRCSGTKTYSWGTTSWDRTKRFKPIWKKSWTTPKRICCFSIHNKRQLLLYKN